MTDLPPELQSLLERAREAHDPSAADAERVRARLFASVALAGGEQALASEGGLSASKPALASKAGSASLLSAQLTSKLLVAALVVGGGAGWWAMQRPLATQPRPVTTPVASATPVDSPDASSVTETSVGRARHKVETPQERFAGHAEATPSSAPVAPERSRASLAERRRRVDTSRITAIQATQRAVAVGETGHGSAEQAASDEVAQADKSEPSQPEASAEGRTRQQELGLLRAALEAINGGRAEQALLLLDSHRLRYPVSVLAEERSGLRVLALCAQGELVLGRRAQAAFLRDHAQSPLAPRVRAACLAGAAE